MDEKAFVALLQSLPSKPNEVRKTQTFAFSGALETESTPSQFK